MLERFIPAAQESVSISVRFSDTLELAVSNSVLDLRAGTLTGSYTLSKTNGLKFEVTLDCRKPADDQTDSWECAHLATGAANSARGRFLRTPPQPVAEDEELQTAPALAEATSHLFLGTATWSDASTAPTRLTLLLPALTRAEELIARFYPATERTVQAFLSLVSSASVSMAPDTQSGTIDGTATLIRSGETRLTLRCRGIRNLAGAP